MRVHLLIIACLGLLAGCAAPQPTLKSGLTLENMDREIRPQDDLYGFANGAWMKRTEIPADKSNYGTFIALADKAREDVLAIIQ